MVSFNKFYVGVTNCAYLVL